jgi:hypothetical protein
MIFDALILCLYALSSLTPLVEPAVSRRTVTQARLGDVRPPAGQTTKLASVVWGTRLR